MPSEAQLVERIETNLLFRWFLDMDPQEAAFDATAFTHNRPRLEKHGIDGLFFDGVVKRAMKRRLTSDEHFSVDGMLIESYASIKSFVPKEQSDDSGSNDGNGLQAAQRRGELPRAEAIQRHARQQDRPAGEAV